MEKKTSNCSICGELCSRRSKICQKCFFKRPKKEKKKFFCSCCGNEITKYAKTGMCISCSNRERKKTEGYKIQLENLIKRNKELVGDKNPNWRGGTSYKYVPKKEKKPKIPKFCIDCGKKISNKATRCKSCAHKGELGNFYGKTHTEENKKKIGDSNKGRWAGQNNPRYKNPLKKEDNPNWDGGKSSISNLIRGRQEYRNWVKSILARDNYTCVLCPNNRLGDSRAILQIDHYPLSLSELIEIYNINSVEDIVNCGHLWNINNGRCLCKECHEKTDTFGHKGAKLKKERKNEKNGG